MELIPKAGAARGDIRLARGCQLRLGQGMKNRPLPSAPVRQEQLRNQSHEESNQNKLQLGSESLYWASAAGRLARGGMGPGRAWLSGLTHLPAPLRCERPPLALMCAYALGPCCLFHPSGPLLPLFCKDQRPKCSHHQLGPTFSRYRPLGSPRLICSAQVFLQDIAPSPRPPLQP